MPDHLNSLVRQSPFITASTKQQGCSTTRESVWNHASRKILIRLMQATGHETGQDTGWCESRPRVRLKVTYTLNGIAAPPDDRQARGLPLRIGRFGSPPRLRRGGRWRSQRRGGATRRCGNIQSSASCHELAYSTRNVRMRIFGSRFRPPPCRCATAVAAVERLSH